MSDQKSQLANPTYKARKDKKPASPLPSLVNSVSIQILGQIPVNNPTKKPAKKKSSSKSSSSTTISTLDPKWLETFSRLDAMLLAKTFQQPTSQTSFSTGHYASFTRPVKQPPSSTLNSERPFIQPTGPVSQTSLLLIPVRCQYCNLPDWSTRFLPVRLLPLLVRRLCPPLQLLVLLLNRTPTATSPVQPIEEEGKVSDQETGVPDQQPDQQLSEDQNFWETVSGVWSLMEWHQVPKFESSASFKDDHPFAGPMTQPTSKISVKLLSDDCSSGKWKS